MATIIIAAPQVNQIAIEEDDNTVVVETSTTAIATIIAQGPQGPQGPAGAGGLVVDQSAKVDLSVVYYDASTATFKANATWTTTTLTDGGNF